MLISENEICKNTKSVWNMNPLKIKVHMVARVLLSWVLQQFPEWPLRCHTKLPPRHIGGKEDRIGSIMQLPRSWTKWPASGLFATSIPTANWIKCGYCKLESHGYSTTHTAFYCKWHSFITFLVSPKGDGPLPEVGAILGQPVKETKQALCILQVTKI